MYNIFQDDKGNYSSMRKGFMMLVYVEMVLLLLSAIAFAFDIIRDNVNYAGMATLFGAITGGGGLTFLAKAMQKRFER